MRDAKLRIRSREATRVFVSVIVPVWNEVEKLHKCLRSLETQTYPSDLYEVIVVDNSSTEKIEPVISYYPHARLMQEQKAGSYAARNAGLAHAQGEIIAFTDADCFPASNWLESGVTHLLRSEGCAVVAGRIEMFPRLPLRPNAVEQYELLISMAQKEFVRKYKFGATANLFTFKQVFERAGPFLGDVKSGGDLEWGRRVVEAGYVLEYSDEVRVFHAARFSLAQLYSKIIRITGGLHDLKRLKGRRYLEFDRSLLLDLAPPVRAVMRILLASSLQPKTERLKVCGVIFFVRYVQVFERFRLAFPRLWNHHTTTR
ncbi:MAG: glycosyltransferase family 2 protein [Pyrinomonadaceae bacterium]